MAGRWQMVREKAQLGAIGAGLADLNEMRLSKFEYALLTAKLMEVRPFVNYGWAKHCYRRMCRNRWKPTLINTYGRTID